MPETPITIDVMLDEETFRRFTMFDLFKRQRRWRGPVLFALILLAFSVGCFVMHERQNAVFLGCLLMTIALGLPAVYFGMFFSSLRTNIAKLKLSPPRHVYSLTLHKRKKGVEIKGVNNEETLTLAWDSLYGAYRVPGCIYLFVSPTRAFLLPDEQASVSADALYDFLSQRLAPEKMHDIR